MKSALTKRAGGLRVSCRAKLRQGPGGLHFRTEYEPHLSAPPPGGHAHPIHEHAHAFAVARPRLAGTRPAISFHPQNSGEREGRASWQRIEDAYLKPLHLHPPSTLPILIRRSLRSLLFPSRSVSLFPCLRLRWSLFHFTPCIMKLSLLPLSLLSLVSLVSAEAPDSAGKCTLFMPPDNIATFSQCTGFCGNATDAAVAAVSAALLTAPTANSSDHAGQLLLRLVHRLCAGQDHS